MSEVFTHKSLIEQGYRREVGKEGMMPGPGFVCYRNTGKQKYVAVAWVGNNATMNDWIEHECGGGWKQSHPTVYAWWIDPLQRDPFYVNYTGEVLIKGEDPMLAEDDVQSA
jgi:hypothetical protein